MERSCRTLSVLMLVLTFALGASAQHTGDEAFPSKPEARPQEKREAAEAALHAIVRAGRLDGLRWPDFSDRRSDVEKLYSRSRYAPVWLRDGHPTPQALQMIDILQQADNEGLRSEDYDASRWTDRLTSLEREHAPGDEARFDAALSVCTMRYASDLRVGRITPRYFHFALETERKDLDLAAFVQQRLAQATDLKSELAAIEPRFAGYQELRSALLKYMRLAKEDDGAKLPTPADIGYPGPPYPGFIRLVRLLGLLGYLPADYSIAAASSEAYDPVLVQAVGRFQERHGLAATGYLDAETVEQLNVPLSYRVEQIRLALERYRWLRYDFPQPPIVVNIAGFRLYAFDGKGQVAIRMRVDVGEDFDSTRTPVMADNIEYLVFRPYWDVPLDIQKDEIVPAILEDPNYLSKYHFEVVARTGQIVTTGKVTKKVLRDLKTGALRVRQRPGPDNALGLLKFIFPNRYNVYLHDIPARDFFFGLPTRVVSHGCVHVEKPAELAAWVLRDQPAWTLQRIEQAMQSGPNNRRVNLSKPLPVLFVYTTASVGRDGEVNFYRDIYGYDAELLHVLAQGYPYPQANESEAKR